MNPIINPFWFYIAGVSDACSSTFSGIAIALIFADLLIGFLLAIVADCGISDAEVNKLLNKLLKTIKILSILCVMLFIASSLLPSRETCYQMIAAQACTPDNLQSAIDADKSIADYIVESAIKIIESTNTAG